MRNSKNSSFLMKNDLKQHEDFVVPRIPEPPVLKFNGTEFEGVVLSDEVTVSPKEIIDNYEENLDYLLEKYGFSKGSSEYDSLKELLF